MTLEYVKFNLFDFQEREVDRLFMQKSRLIAWEMGTGKTYAGIALDMENRGRSEAKHGPGGRKTLVVCPKSALDVWDQHCMELTDLDVHVIDAKNRDVFLRDVMHPDREGYFIVHYEALRLMPELKKVKFFHIIADECHRVKNRKAQQTLAFKQLVTLYKTAMSGTPADNKPHDLWSILNWLWPKVYTSYWNFWKAHVETELTWEGYRKVVGVKNMSYLRNQMAPWYTRLLKKDVLKDLPDKYYTELWVDLDPKQREAYDQMQQTMVAWVQEQDKTSPLIASAVVAQLVRLQQFALGYMIPKLDDNGKPMFRPDKWVVDKNTGEGYWKPGTQIFTMIDPSSKLDSLMEVIQDNSEDQFVIFSQQKQVMPLLAKRLEAKEITHGFYTGGVSQKNRDQLVRSFQAGETRIFAGTIASGGVSITLTNASTVVFLDRGWNPGINEQAEDRCHRIGQVNAVQVVDMMAKNTVDIGRKEMLSDKSDWLHSILGDEVTKIIKTRYKKNDFINVEDDTEEGIDNG
jgi:SNF2 family DNA or RNA helicase